MSPQMTSDGWAPLMYIEMVACPICGASDRSLCTWPNRGYPGPHAERVDATRRAYEAGLLEEFSGASDGPPEEISGATRKQEGRDTA